MSLSEIPTNSLQNDQFVKNLKVGKKMPVTIEDVLKSESEKEYPNWFQCLSLTGLIDLKRYNRHKTVIVVPREDDHADLKLKYDLLKKYKGFDKLIDDVLEQLIEVLND